MDLIFGVVLLIIGFVAGWWVYNNNAKQLKYRIKELEEYIAGEKAMRQAKVGKSKSVADDELCEGG